MMEHNEFRGMPYCRAWNACDYRLDCPALFTAGLALPCDILLRLLQALHFESNDLVIAVALGIWSRYEIFQASGVLLIFFKQSFPDQVPGLACLCCRGLRVHWV